MTGGLSYEMLGLIAPAFCAGMVVAITHVLLGLEVLKRGIIFIDLAIAQIAALGSVVSSAVFGINYGLLPHLAALIFALCGSLLFARMERHALQHQEAFIGCAFILAASLILLLLAGDPHGGEHIQGLLAGQILWATWTQIGIMAVLSAIIVLLWRLFAAHKSILFYVIFPVAVTLSVQMVGVYLVFASLIIPALAAAGFRNRIRAGYGIAFIAIASGLMLSVITDAPSGPVIVWCYAISGLVFHHARKLCTG
ncbi:MAG: metal ABC transporter permease [Rhodospirillales bacterium]|nr:metal ABC transporter permease [Rhodospirillales bacterium]